jgi:hypothetical protein
MNLPPVPVPTGEPISLRSTYARVAAGYITADVERFAYWHPNENQPEPEVTFEVRISGLPDHCGTADVAADRPETLCDLATVCIQAAQLLNEAQQQGRNQMTPLNV